MFDSSSPSGPFLSFLPVVFSVKFIGVEGANEMGASRYPWYIFFDFFINDVVLLLTYLQHD